jgi:hypothetical protein
MADARSRPTQFAANPVSPSAFTPQPATNDLDIRQGQLAELDLGFESGHIRKCGGRHDKTLHILLKPKKRGFNKIHLNLQTQKQYYMKNTPRIKLLRENSFDKLKFFE